MGIILNGEVSICYLDSEYLRIWAYGCYKGFDVQLEWNEAAGFVQNSRDLP